MKLRLTGLDVGTTPFLVALRLADADVLLGGRTAREIAEQQKIDERGGVDALLNSRNPIGPARFGRMPQPYARP